jgi:hypothetical protein
MSRQGIRDGTAAYFNPPAIRTLNTVFTGEPRDVPTTMYTAGHPGDLAGAIAFFFIEHQHDRFQTFSGSSTQGRWVHYDMAMAVRFRGTHPTGQAALDDHDALIDAIVASIRADPTLGGVSKLWEAGMGDREGGTEDIFIDSGLPKAITKGGPIVIWSAIRFKCVEVL